MNTAIVKHKITIEVTQTVYALLATLHEKKDVQSVVAELIDHAQQGVYRPGAWERSWLEQVFGKDWQERLEQGDPYGREETGVCSPFQRPRAAATKGGK